MSLIAHSSSDWKAALERRHRQSVYCQSATEGQKPVPVTHALADLRQVDSTKVLSTQHTASIAVLLCDYLLYRGLTELDASSTSDCMHGNIAGADVFHTSFREAHHLIKIIQLDSLIYIRTAGFRRLLAPA